MEINYLILAHKDPLQVRRLISQLKSDATNFYIHIDLQTDIDEFKRVLSHTDIYFLSKRFKGTWGDIGIVQATLYGIKKIYDTDKKGYCILLSGQDYPLRPKQNIQRFLKAKFPTEFMTIYPIPHSGWDFGGMDRIEKYKINKSGKRKHFLQLPTIFESEFHSLETFGKLNFLRKIGKFKEINLILKKRKFPAYLKPYGGSQWWALTMETIKEIIDYIEEHPDYINYHQYSLLPDEIFFQSILMELKQKKPRRYRIERSLTYVNWERASGPLPVTFGIEDFEELKKASKDHLFARKFDIDKDTEVLDKIDTNLLS